MSTVERVEQFVNGERGPYEKVTADLRALLALVRACDSTLQLLEEAPAGTWCNGVTHPDYPGPDEGDVRAGGIIHEFRTALEAVTRGE
jgi:hypothetical protein